MATNRADTLDPALLRPGRLDRKIEFPVPDRRQKRLVFQVITSKMNLSEEVDLEDCSPLSFFFPSPHLFLPFSFFPSFFLYSNSYLSQQMCPDQIKLAVPPSTLFAKKRECKLSERTVMSFSRRISRRVTR